MTKKPILNFIIEPELLAQVDDFWHQNKFPSRAAAVKALLGWAVANPYQVVCSLGGAEVRSPLKAPRVAEQVTRVAPQCSQCGAKSGDFILFQSSIEADVVLVCSPCWKAGKK